MITLPLIGVHNFFLIIQNLSNFFIFLIRICFLFLFCFESAVFIRLLELCGTTFLMLHCQMKDIVK